MLRFTKRNYLLSEYINERRADRLDEWSMDDLSKYASKYEEIILPIFEAKDIIKIGDTFVKQISSGKSIDCEVVDIVKKISTTTGKIIETEYYAKSNNYAMGQSFEVSKTTILRGR